VRAGTVCDRHSTQTDTHSDRDSRSIQTHIQADRDSHSIQIHIQSNTAQSVVRVKPLACRGAQQLGKSHCCVLLKVEVAIPPGCIRPDPKKDWVTASAWGLPRSAIPTHRGTYWET